MAITTTTTTEDRALSLLGSGYPTEVVANACGVSASRISQLLSDETFANKVAELKFTNLQKHNELDSTYDKMESQLMNKLNGAIPLMIRPMEILKAVSVINAAKRRGSSAPEQSVAQSTIVNLVLPVAITQQFTTNINNQVIKAGDQTLLTIQSNTLRDAAKKRAEEKDENELKTITIR